MTAPAAGSSDSTKDQGECPNLGLGVRVCHAGELLARAVAAEAQLANKEAIGEQLKSALDRSNRDLSAHTMADLHTHGCVDCGRRVDQVMEAQMVAEHFKRGEAAALVTLDKIREWRQGVIDHCSAERINPPAWCASLAALLGERQQT